MPNWWEQRLCTIGLEWSERHASCQKTGTRQQNGHRYNPDACQSQHDPFPAVKIHLLEARDEQMQRVHCFSLDSSNRSRTPVLIAGDDIRNVFRRIRHDPGKLIFAVGGGVIDESGNASIWVLSDKTHGLIVANE